MGDKKFTLVELHIDGETRLGLGSIGKALPIGGTETTSETESATTAEPDSETSDDDESGGKGKSAVGALVALLVLVGIAVAARKFRGGDQEDDLDAEEEPDVIVN